MKIATNCANTFAGERSKGRLRDPDRSRGVKIVQFDMHPGPVNYMACCGVSAKGFVVIVPS
jgi:hypothetical protein